MQVRCSFEIYINFLYKAKKKYKKLKERKLKNQKHAYLILFTRSIIVQVRYSTFQTKELSIIEYGKLLFPSSYTGKGLDAFGVSAFTCVLVRKKKFPRSNKGQFFCFNWTVFYD